jgi:quercetin dioxygenase-like cupin family protein
MAKAGERIDHPYAESLIFKTTSSDSGGQLLEVESIFHARSERPPDHYHPHQEERFEVLKGAVWTRIDGKERVYQAGESIVAPPGTRHAMTNMSTEDEARVLSRMTPALKTEELLETLWGLARDGKTNKHGVPNLLQAALLLQDYRDEFRLSNPPEFVQVPLFALLAALARLLGHRSRYANYSGEAGE